MDQEGAIANKNCSTVPLRPTSSNLSLCELFNNRGYIEIPGIIAEQSLDVLRLLVMSRYHELQEIITQNGLHFGIGIKNGFKEIVQRQPGRFEMPYRMESEEIDSLVNLSHLHGIVKNIFEQSDEVEIINKSLILSLPGTVVSFNWCHAIKIANRSIQQCGYRHLCKLLYVLMYST